MSMKQMAAIAGMAAMCGASIQTSAQTTTQERQAAILPESIEIENTTVPEPGPSLGYCKSNYYGCSPKEYGQYLQRVGRQRWVKKKRK